MPYKSDAQRRLFHAKLKRGEISADTVHEFDEASKGMNLPEHVGERSNPLRGTRQPRRKKEK